MFYQNLRTSKVKRSNSNYGFLSAVAFVLSVLMIFPACSDDTTTYTPEPPPSALVDMVALPGGTFQMGDINGRGYSNEVPVHAVTLSPFRISRFEITQRVYLEITGSNPSHHSGSDRPAEMMTWYEAVEFCNLLSKKEGLDTCYSGEESGIACDFAANGYRLPTEAEWEYACRAGTTTEYFNGNSETNLSSVGWYAGNANTATHNVGGKEVNPFGLYDTHGNVVEWCWDRYDPVYYRTSPSVDPRGPDSGTDRVQRGGSYFQANIEGCRSAFRSNYLAPKYGGRDTGFRVVRTGS